MNRHYRFWVDYYRSLWRNGMLPASDAKQNNDNMTRAYPTDSPGIPAFSSLSGKVPGYCATELQVQYPGLLSGLGYIHSCGEKEADAQEIGLGILLDPVSGLPYLPGSTVKGLLRYAFMMDNGKFLLEMLNETKPCTPVQLEKLEYDIFGSRQEQSGYRFRDKSLQNAGMGKDLFLDAYPISADSSGKILGLESITPHRANTAQMQGLTAPLPLTLLKILPGVTLRFPFVLTDSTVDGFTLTAGEKQTLFGRILLLFGAGAKTDVGFGVLAEQSQSPEAAPQTPEAKPASAELLPGLYDASVVYSFPKKGNNTTIPNGIRLSVNGCSLGKLSKDDLGISDGSMILEKYPLDKPVSVRITGREGEKYLFELVKNPVS